MVWQLVGFLRRMPRAHPTASTVITGIGGLIWTIAGIMMSVMPAGYGQQSNLAGGLFCILIGLASLGLALFAAFDTQGFQNWARPDGSYGHAVARWMGPATIIISIIWLIFGLWLASTILEGMARK